MSDQGKITTRISDGIGEIKFFHPRGNSLPSKLLNDLAQTITDFGSHTQVQVIVLKSEGDKVFCGGASFDELQAIKSAEEGQKFFMGFAQVILAVRSCPKFVIGRVQGKVVGGGVGLVSACDYALATDTASIRLSEFALGFGPFVISPAVQRKLGLSAFSALTIDTEWRDAQWAKHHGLYVEIFATLPALDEAVAALCKKLVQSNPEATSRIKKILWDGTERFPQLLEERASLSSELVRTDFVQSAIQAVQQKTR